MIRPRKYIYTAYEPRSVRRRRHRRLVAAGLGVATVAATVPLLAHQATGADRGPQALDAAAVQTTQLAPHIVVYSLPTRGGGHSHSDGDSDSHGSGGGHSGHHGSSGSSGDDQQNSGDSAGAGEGSGSGQNGSGGVSTIAPQITDGSSGHATVTNSNPSGTTTYTNGVPAASSTQSAGSSLPAASPAAVLPPVAAPGSVWPPLQTQDGTPATVPPAASSPVPVPVPSSVPSPSVLPVSTPPLSSGMLDPSLQAAPRTGGLAQPAMMLMQVQCPGAQAGLVCFETTNTTGAAAAMPSTSSLPSLPLAVAPGTTATTCPVTASGAGVSASSADDGSSSGSSSDSSGGDSSGGGHSGGGKHHSSHKGKGGHQAKDSSDILPAGPDGSTTPTLTSCGLVQQADSTLGQVGMGSSATLNSVGSTVGAGAGGVVDKALMSSPKAIATGTPKTVKLATTGYSFQDNTPPNSNKISCGTIHSVAGGIGTYADPISVAVPGHDGQGAGGDELTCGERIYYPAYKFYGIVEDTGASKYSLPHTDIYVDGATPATGGGSGSPAYTAAQSKKCMDPVSHIEDGTEAIVNPPPNEPVRAPGPITQGDRCDVGGSS